MTNFPGLRGRHRAGAVVVAAGCLMAIPAALQAQAVPTIALAAASGAEGAVTRAAAVPAAAPFVQSAYPPKPSWKEERMVRAEALYQEGYRLYQSGDRDGARKLFDQAIDSVLNSRSEPVNRSSFDKRFEELVRSIYRIDVDAIQNDNSPESLPSYDKAPIDDILSLTFPVDPKLKLKVREEVGVTVSQLPLEASDAVLSFINYFSGDRGRRTLVAGLKRAGRYKPMISRILDEEGIPQEFIFLAQAESGFLPRAMSYMAAGGMWQFIRETGAKYGLKHDMWVDERFDPEMATRAAARHLRDLYNEFGDWYLAIAAYNCGQGNVDKAVAKTGYADVWELRSRGTLPLETSNYVPIILAMTIMAKNPANYGIEDVEPDEPLEYETIEIAVPTSLALVADITGRTVAELKDLNPALLRDMAPAGYKMHIPRGSSQVLMSGLDMIPAARRATWRAHRADEGDTLAALASRYRTTAAALASANQFPSGELTAGSLVVIPAAPRAAAPAKSVRSAAGKPAKRFVARSTPSRRTAGHASNVRSNATRTSKTASPSSKPVAKASSGSSARRRQG